MGSKYHNSNEFDLQDAEFDEFDEWEFLNLYNKEAKRGDRVRKSPAQRRKVKVTRIIEITEYEE